MNRFRLRNGSTIYGLEIYDDGCGAWVSQKGKQDLMVYWYVDGRAYTLHPSLIPEHQISILRPEYDIIDDDRHMLPRGSISIESMYVASTGQLSLRDGGEYALTGHEGSVSVGWVQDPGCKLDAGHRHMYWDIDGLAYTTDPWAFRPEYDLVYKVERPPFDLFGGSGLLQAPPKKRPWAFRVLRHLWHWLKGDVS